LRLFYYALILYFCSIYGHASITILCDVSYEKKYGWSSDYRREVTFISGSELNDATSSYNYHSLYDYVLLFFGEGEVAISKLPFRVGGAGFQDFELSHLESYYSFNSLYGLECEQVNSQYKRIWKIKAKEFLTWIDPRLR
jgi:hypothetical protein